MKTNRRSFLSTALVGGLTATVLPRGARGAEETPAPVPLDLASRYARLDEILKSPVLSKELFPTPVIIEKIELLRDRKNFLCRVRSSEGVEVPPETKRFSLTRAALRKQFSNSITC